MSNIIINLFTPAGFIGLLEVLFFVLEVMYVLFAFVVVRQVSLLNRSFKTDLAAFFKFLAYVHMFSSMAVVLISYLFLF